MDGRCVLATAADSRDTLTVRLVKEGFWRLHTMVVNCLSLVWKREDVQQVETHHYEHAAWGRDCMFTSCLCFGFPFSFPASLHLDSPLVLPPAHPSL